MAKKKASERRRKTTIGVNPLDQLEQVPGKGRKKARFKDASPQSEIKEVLLKPRRSKQEGALSKLIKSVLGPWT